MPTRENNPQRSEGDPGGRKRNGGNIVETVVSLISGAAILAILGYLAWQGLRPSQPPLFQIDTGKSRQVGNRFQLPVHVRNVGDEAAQSVHVVVEMENPSTTEPEKGEITIDWIPGQSVRSGFVIFTEDPARGKLTATVDGFQLP